MQMRIFTLIKFFAICTALVFANCASRPPAATQVNTGSVAPLASTINIPIYMRNAVVENIINEQLPNVLFDGPASLGSLGQANMVVRKSGRIRLQMQGAEIISTAPLDVHIRVGSGIAQANVVAKINVRMRSRVSIANNWRMNVSTTITGYEWTSDPVMRLGPMSIPVKSVADPIMPRIMGDIGKLVDASIASALNVRAIVTPVWTTLQEPIPLDIQPNLRVWLRITPTEIMVSQPRGAGGSVFASLGLTADVEVFLDKPNERRASPLPNFKPHTRTDSTFSINANINLTYPQATALGKQTLVGTTYKRGVRRLKFHDLEIKSGQNGATDVMIDVTGSVSGIIYASGVAAFNANEQTIHVNGLDLRIESKNRYHRMKNRMVSGLVLSEASRHTQIPLKKTLNDAKITAQRTIASYKLPMGFALRSNIDSVTLRGVEVTQHGISAAVSINGMVRVEASGD